MKKVGFIGGSGFIGSYNVKKFLDEGYPVKVSAKKRTGRQPENSIYQSEELGIDFKPARVLLNQFSE